MVTLASFADCMKGFWVVSYTSVGYPPLNIDLLEAFRHCLAATLLVVNTQQATLIHSDHRLYAHTLQLA